MNYYYIQGSPARAKEIKAAFERLGIRADGYDFSRIDVLFFTFEAKGKTYMMSSLLGTGLDNIILTHPGYKELELPKPHYEITNFKPFDKVLARDTENEKWVASLFSNFEYGAFPHKFVCIDTCYTQCIPFEGNEHLLGTTDMPSEEYINW